MCDARAFGGPNANGRTCSLYVAVVLAHVSFRAIVWSFGAARTATDGMITAPRLDLEEVRGLQSALTVALLAA